MNSNHRYGSIAAVDAWTDAGFPRPDRADDHVYWEAGAVLGTGIGGLDTVGGKLVPMTDAGKVRRLGSTIVEQVMSSGISARVSGILALGNQVTTNSSACSTGTEAILDGANRIRMGLAERMVCGGSEGDSHYSWAGFDGMRVLSQPVQRRAGEGVAADERQRRRLRARRRRRRAAPREPRVRDAARRPHLRRAARRRASTAAATAAAAA